MHTYEVSDKLKDQGLTQQASHNHFFNKKISIRSKI